MREQGERVIGLLYPRRCPVCFEPVAAKGELICPACRKKLRYLQEPLCRCCGTPVQSAEQEYCFSCQKKAKSFTSAASVFAYPSVSRALLALKYKDKKEFADFFAWEIADRLGTKMLAWEPEALIPVPLHWTRKLGRGYNQAELLARRVGALLELPVRSDALKRCRRTRPQSRLAGRQRQQNLETAFAAAPCGLRRVVLIDDIYTTGSTADACARALRRSGVETVRVVTAACGQDG